MSSSSEICKTHFKALVIGGTGATGRSVIGELLKSPCWEVVKTIARREINEGSLPEEYRGKVDISKLKHETVDDLSNMNSKQFEGMDFVFCSLGTTREISGSAENFLKVDYEYVKTTAVLAKAAGVKHFSLVTAQVKD